MNQYIIQWSKWKDPFKQLSHNRRKDNILEEEIEENEFSDLSEYNGPVMQTEFGIVPINETNCPSSAFNLWRGDTNFPFEKYHKFLIDTTLGVEAADFHTPYRFRIAIGKLFNEKDVMKRVEKRLIEYTNNKVSSINKNNLYETLSKQYPFFAVIVNQGKKRVFHGNTSDEVDLQVNEYLREYPQVQVTYNWK